MNPDAKDILIKKALSLSPEKQEKLRETLIAGRVANNISQDKYLAAHIVLAPGETGKSSDQIALELEKSLPNYMIPKSFVYHSELPTTANGKVDKEALIKSSLINSKTSSTTFKTPGTSKTQELLIQVWKDVLGAANVLASDNFFELGGDSILAIQVVSEIRKIGFSITVSDLFNHPTIGQLSELLSPNEVEKPKGANLPQQATQEIRHIWSDVLGKEEISPQSNFFELGGDSILAITLISRMKSKGFDVSVSQLFKNPTPEGLSKPIESDTQKIQDKVSARSPKIQPAKELPFTPIQNWFFENDFINPDHWNQSILLEVDPSITYQQIEEAYSTIYERHDSLRLSFRKSPTRYIQSINSFERKLLPIQKQTILEEEDFRLDTIIETVANSLQHTIRIREGRLLKATFFARESGKSNRLLLVAHHLAVDAISLNILCEELNALLCARPLATNAIRSQYTEWGSALQQRAVELAKQNDYAFWKNQDYVHCSKIPFDKGSLIHNQESSAQSICFELSIEHTQALLKKATSKENSIRSYLLTALNLGLKEWLRSSTFLIGIESHGREEIDPNIEANTIVGWLTDYYPFVSDLSYSQTDQQALNDIRYQFSKIPNNGIDYGLIRNGMYSDPALLSHAPQPEITLNYLGRRVARSNAEKPLTQIGQRIGNDRDPRNKRTAIFEINAIIIDEQLHFDFGFSNQLHHKSTVQKIVATISTKLVSFATSASPHATPENVESVHPLTSIQQGLLLHKQSSPQNDQGEIFQTGEIEGNISINQIQEAWQKIVDRHPALRSSIDLEKSFPVLKVHKSPHQKIVYSDFSQLGKKEQETRVKEFIDTQRDAPLSIHEPSIANLAIAQTDSDSFLLTWKCHHIFIDGWSSSIVIRDLLEELDTPSNNLREDRQYSLRGYDSWIQSKSPTEAAKFWIEYLQDARNTLVNNTPLDIRAISKKREKVSFDFPEDVLIELKSSALRLQTTPSSLAIASWALVLGQITQQTSVTFGIALSGRDHPVDNLDTMVGNFANVVPFQTSFPVSNLSAWIQSLTLNQNFVSKYGYTSSAQILDWVDKSRPPLSFDTSLAIANFPWNPEDKKVIIRNFKGDSTATNALSVSLIIERTLSISIDFDTHLVTPAYANAVLSLFEKTLKNICSQKQIPINDLLARSTLKPVEALQGKEVNDLKARPNAPCDTSDTTEQILIELLNEILPARDCQVDDNFFEIGGTSLQAVRFFSAIEKKFHTKLPVSTLFKHPSIREIAPLLENPDDQKSNFQNLVEINQGAERPPLFLIHAAGLEILFYRDFASSLDPELPVYGLQPIGLDGKEKPIADIRVIASRYIEEIQKKYPNGPYFILGHCFGGLIAIEIAKQLASRNFDVPLVISLDGPAPQIRTFNVQNPSSPTSKLSSNRFIRILKKGQLISRVLSKIDRTLKELKLELRYKFGDPKSQRDILEKRLNECYIKAVRKYSTDPYPSSVVQIKCYDSEEFPNHSDLAWKNSVPNSKIIDVDYSHADILEGANAEHVAAIVTDELNQCYFHGALTSKRSS
ncbi:condensation domain-containing protein [Puniceicoccaceae bacterium K14]|nr:condensation domain-containing protein [Puniceicoccaceae bacterium K14]